MKQFNPNMPALVTGIQRSGTSLIARIINICGAFGGKTTEMQENFQIKKVMDDFYKKEGLNDQYPLPKSNLLNIPNDFGQILTNSLQLEGYTGSNIWMYKSHRIFQIWPVWNYAFPSARWIIVRRRTGDIIESCLKTAYMDAFKDRDGWLKWVHEQESILREMIESGVNCKVIWPERMAYGDFKQIYEMLEWLGLDWNPEIVNKILPLLKK